MKGLLIIAAFLFTLGASAQTARDTVLSRCPVFITDTASNNNFFLQARPVTLKVYRVKGDLTIVFEQKDQLFSMFFHTRRLSTRNDVFKIEPGSRGSGDVEATYSFKSGDQVAYINVSKGKLETTYDKITKLWHVKVNGWISNMVGTGVSYYKVATEFSIQ